MQCLQPAPAIPSLAKLCKMGGMGLRSLPLLLYGKKPVRPAQHKPSARESHLLLFFIFGLNLTSNEKHHKTTVTSLPANARYLPGVS